ncbi:unnamed protein product [Blepharisma stoltei]|uniref:Protein kinase domain-containing protein n=1 Tax=Blepharisma stoltei TaxID=1481888 RepID=A0AAU9K3A4_9CILI|nr:unnamed protein product [Blepharisma stoltei]
MQSANSNQPNAKNIGHYLLGRTIGQGTFGKVKIGTHILTSEKVAVKILEKERIKDISDIERVSREIHILKLIRHPNIIQLYEIIETQSKLFLIMEYASGGELFDYIVAEKKIKELEACKYFQQIIAGVEYIHRLGVAHRDLKPENLLLDSKKNIKIVDFGLSNTYKEGEKLKTACGSPCYAAPEMIDGKDYNGLKADIWSCGVILYAMLAGYLPFEDPDTGKLYKKILKGKYEIPDWISKDARDLLGKILSTEPNKRITVEKIKSHPWFSLMHQNTSNGLLVGYSTIPVNQSVLRKLDEYGFDLNYCQRCIEANKHNHLTTTYYLLYRKLSPPPDPEPEPKPPIIRPSFVPAPPIAPEINEKFNHRKYHRKKVESTGGSSSNEGEILFGKQIASRSNRNSPRTVIKSIYTHISGPRNLSTGRHPQEPTIPRPANAKAFRRKIVNPSQHNTPKKVNKSVDYGKSIFGESSKRHTRANSSLVSHRKTDRIHF